MQHMHMLIARSDGMGWFWHQITSALIHSAIYGVMYHVFKGMGMVGAILTGIVVLMASWLIYRLNFNK